MNRASHDIARRPRARSADPTPLRHPQSGDGVDEATLDVQNAVTTAEEAVSAIDAIVRELAQTVAAIRILAANGRTRTAPGVEAATSSFSEAARLLQDMADQSALLAQLMPLA